MDETKAYELWHAKAPDGTFQYSAKEIAEKLGVTKGVLVGVAHRRGFETRGSPIKRDGTATPRVPRPRVAKPPASAAVDVRLAPGEGCAWVTTCKAPWRFCDAPRKARSPYCPKHHDRAYVTNPG